MKENPNSTDLNESGTLEERFRTNPEQIRLLTELLASIGNSEAKAACLLAMKKGELYTQWFLRKEFLAQTGNAWEQTERSVRDYCIKTFEPIGLVAKSIVTDPGKETEKVYYQITDKGENLGKPLAAYMIDFSNRHNISLTQLFGEIHVPNPDANPRPPITRLRLLVRLATSDLNRQIDLEHELGLKGGAVKEHLKALHQAGFVNEIPSSYHRGFNYKLTKNEVTQAVTEELVPTLIGFVQMDPLATTKVKQTYFSMVTSKDYMQMLQTAVTRAKDNSSQLERYQSA